MSAVLHRAAQAILGVPALNARMSDASVGLASAEIQTDQQLTASQVALLYDLDRGAGYVPLLVIAALSAMNWAHANAGMTVIVFAMYCGGFFWIEWLQKAYRAKPVPHAQARLWGDRYALASIVTGAGWGLLAVAWFDPSQPMHAFITFVVIGSTCMGSLIVRSAYFPALIAFMVPALAPSIPLLAIQGSVDLQILAVFSAVFMIVMTNWGRVLARDRERMIRTQIERDGLVADLIEAREKAEQETHRRQAVLSDVQAASQAKSAFLATMSHELRTPLNGIIGMTHVLELSELSVTDRDCVSTIRSSGEALSGILGNILDYVSVDTGRDALTMVKVDLSTLVRDVEAGMRAGLAEKPVELVVRIGPYGERPVYADATRLKQVLFNLIGNAVKFTNEGAIWVEVGMAQTPPIPRTDDPDNWSGMLDQIMVTVTDTGIGIAEHHQKTLFEPFRQVDSSLSRAHGGVGLGLAVCKRMIEAMGGTIGVMSEEGKGSTFWFTVPFAATEAEMETPEDQSTLLAS